MDEITPKQEDVLNLLPNTRQDIADELGITYRSVRYRMDSLEEAGYDFERDGNNVWSVVGMSDREGGNVREEEEPQRVNSYDKAQATKEVHNTLTELEQEVKEALNNTEPVVSDYTTTEGSSTLVMPHSDSHVGAVIKDRPEVDYYGAEQAQGAIVEYFDRCINAARERGDVEDVVLIMNGDHLDGEGVYASQRHSQEDNLRDQLRKAGNTYIEQVLKLSREFENVSVYCVPGNHGVFDRESTTNADNMLYDFVETALHYADADNIHFEKSSAAGNNVFDIRGWTYFCRHGENYLQHVGTSNGIRRAQDWWMKHQFDVGIRSHYHTILYETIGDEVPIVMTGSTAPASTFAESRGGAGGKAGVYWFTTDEQVIDDFQPIRFNS